MEKRILLNDEIGEKAVKYMSINAMAIIENSIQDVKTMLLRIRGETK